MPAPTNGLILHWNLQDLAGSAYLDLSSSGINGNRNGLDSFTTGTVGNSRHFGASASYVALSTYVDISTPNTISMWLRNDSVGAGSKLAIWLQKDSTVGRKLGFYTTAAGTSIFLASGSNSTASSVQTYKSRGLRAAVWYHVSVTFSATAASAIYFGGTFNTSVTKDQTWGLGTRQKIIGDIAGGGNPWVGDIDEVRIYNRILTSTEINNVFTDTINYGPKIKKRLGVPPPVALAFGRVDKVKR